MQLDNFRLANDAWNVFYRAQATLAHEFAEADVWGGLLGSEYAVLYALSTEPEGLRLSELHDDVLITQPGISRLITRLETRGLVQRRPDDDGRARRICLTAEGSALQKRVGTAHARHIATALGRALTTEQLESLRDISQALLAATPHEQESQK